MFPLPDFGLLRGETVRVRVQDAEPSFDEFGDEVYATSEWDVENVLVAPGPRADLPGSERPEGVRVVYNLHFGRDFDESLRGADVRVRGRWFRVIGDPQHYSPENTPGPWTMPVEVEAVEG